MPTAGQRPGLGLAIADNAGYEQVGIVECGAVSMRERIAKLATFVNRARSLGRCMTRNAAGKGELLKKPFDASLILGDVRIDLAIGSLQISIGHDSRSAVPRTGDEDHVQVLFLDHAIQMHIDEVQTRGCSPMA